MMLRSELDGVMFCCGVLNSLIWIITFLNRTQDHFFVFVAF